MNCACNSILPPITIKKNKTRMKNPGQLTGVLNFLWCDIFVTSKPGQSNQFSEKQ